jgi:hypothetical protein
VARIRTVKPEFWSDEQVMECSPLARLMFIGIWNFCDDAGNHPLSEKTIKALVFPGDSIGSAEIRRLLVELSSNALLRFYECSGKAYLNVKGWRHQKIDRPTIKHPDFDEGIEVFPDDLWPAGQVVADESSNIRRVVDEASPPEGKGKGREGKGEDQEHLSTYVDGQGLGKPKRVRDETPYAEILACYQRVCTGKFLGAEVLNAKRKANIKRAYDLTVRDEQPFKDRGIEFWEKYFTRCTTNKHWCGENDRGWKADLEFVTRESSVLKVLGV